MAVNGKHDIELNGQGLLLYKGDYAKNDPSPFAPPQVVSDTPGEQGIDEFWWTKRFTDFSGGYDQKYAEAEDAQPNAFFDSEDTNVSTPGEFRPMRTMSASKALTTSNTFLLPALGWLWGVDGALLWRFAGSTWFSSGTIGGSGTINHICDDGQKVYSTWSGGGVYTSDASVHTEYATPAQAVAQTQIAFINKTLYGVVGIKLRKLLNNAVAEIIYDAGSGWILNCITEHNKEIVFGGYKGSAGDEKSYVWRSTGTTAGTKLLVDDLPHGFRIRRLFSYSDVVFILGGWDTEADTRSVGVVYGYTNGALTLLGYLKESAHVGNPNPEVDPTIDMAPRIAFAHGQFVYFSSFYKTSLWRYDLKNGGISRSWSAASANNQVTGAAIYKGKVYLAYAGAGVYVESSTYKSSGWLKTPITTFGTSNPKIGKEVVLSTSTMIVPTADYTGDNLPAGASPAWTKTSTGSPSESVSGGILTTVGGTTSTQYYTRASLGLSNAIGTTIETRLKIVTASTGATKQCVVQIEDGTKTAYFILYLAGTDLFVDLVSGSTIKSFGPLTSGKYHTYRLTLKGNLAQLYVDGVSVTSLGSLAASANNQIIFGDMSATSMAHEENWNYLAYWTTGAFAPGSLAVGTNPFTVHASTDGGQRFVILDDDSTYKKYSLRPLGHFDSLMLKIVCTNPNVAVKDITALAVPVVTGSINWEMTVNLSSDGATIDGEDITVNPQTIYEGLQTALTTQLAQTYRDIDYDIAAVKTIYNVLIEKMQRARVQVEDGDIVSVLKLWLRQV